MIKMEYGNFLFTVVFPPLYHYEKQLIKRVFSCFFKQNLSPRFKKRRNSVNDL